MNTFNGANLARLAIVSQPSFDPNLFVDGISHEDYARLRDDPARPLFNRALSGQYPPGSTIKPMIGLGGLQIVLTTVAIGAVALGFGLAWQSALAIGMILALSSTAIVLQTLNEKGWMKSVGGKNSFAVLLTQDIAVIPMLALLPVLAISGQVAGGDAHHGGSVLQGLPAWIQAVVVLLLWYQVMIQSFRFFQ